MQTSHRFITALIAAMLAGAPGAAAQDNSDGSRNGLTIELDADSTYADGPNGRIRFEGVRIRQGELMIRAQQAESSGLDFADSEWTFRGNVVFRSIDTSMTADTAVLTFRSQRLARVQLTGSPLTFEQDVNGKTRLTSNDAVLEFRAQALARAVFSGAPVNYELQTPKGLTSSRADNLVYDATAGVLTLRDNAWIGDGGREITGSTIEYNFREQRVVAASDDSGQNRVKIIITPPEQQNDNDDVTVKEPETTTP